MSISWESAVENEKNETQEYSVNPIINKKVKNAVSGLQKTIQKYFIRDIINEKDKELAADFIISCVKQDGVKLTTKRVYVIALAYLCRYHADKNISLDKLTADMLYDYIDSFRPTFEEKAALEAKKEATDEEEARLLQQLDYQSWMSNQKTLCEPLKKFYKWLAYPYLTAQQRKRLPRDKWPDVLRRFELALKDTGARMTPVKDSDIWEEKDIAIFLKYCADNRYSRLRLFHVMAWETSARPSELLQLRIADIEDNLQQDENGEPLAVFEVGRNGKNKYAHRNLGITKLSLQYYNWYLHSHPDPKNRKAFLFSSLEYSALGRNLPIEEGSLQKEYTAFRDKVIPQLLKRSDVPEEDKKHLVFLRDVRKWYPYIVRHSSLTKLANDPNVNEYALRKHAGWSKTSRMIEIYTHRRESVEPVMLALGVKLKNSKKKQAEELKQQMNGPQCPFCLTANIPSTQLCIKCHKPIASNAMDSVMKEAEETKKKLAQLEIEQQERFKEMQQQIAAHMERSITAFNLLKDEIKVRRAEVAEKREVNNIDGITFPEAFKLAPRKNKEKKDDYNKSNY